jgi:hypothetical protein
MNLKPMPVAKLLAVALTVRGLGGVAAGAVIVLRFSLPQPLRRRCSSLGEPTSCSDRFRFPARDISQRACSSLIKKASALRFRHEF